MARRINVLKRSAIIIRSIRIRAQLATIPLLYEEPRGSHPTLERHYVLYYNTSNIRATKGRGVYLQDATGRWYMDCSAGTFNLSLGYSHPQSSPR